LWEDGLAAGQSRFEAARLLRTKYGYVELARALLEVAARDDVAAKVELGYAYRYGDWGVCENFEESFRWQGGCPGRERTRDGGGVVLLRRRVGLQAKGGKRGSVD
jgi:hypothetical protein